jgi:hypothetical protein
MYLATIMPQAGGRKWLKGLDLMPAAERVAE